MLHHFGVCVVRQCVQQNPCSEGRKIDAFLLAKTCGHATEEVYIAIGMSVSSSPPQATENDERKSVTKATELNRHTTRMKIRGSVASLSFIFPIRRRIKK